ncbi:unnamed protein product [Effrenium voratum]|uniref:Uncharacterized protein n=1 Tax=Effrenium voratum TaxID=2562239 RepID=A0AA36NCP8_9DINO|nr:unnamed protein product [Effrenium voratum]
MPRKNWNLGKSMFCAKCNHPKPTINTMGQRAYDFYPLANQKMFCEGQKNCPECHAIVHSSHSECLACRDRKQNAATVKAHQACVVTTASGSKDAMRSDAIHALKGPEMLALTRPRTAVDDLEDKYRGSGMDALAIIDDLEKAKAGAADAIDALEEKRRIVAEEEKERQRERQREAQRREAEEQAKKDLEIAKQQAEAMEVERKRKREAAQSLIAAMLEEDTASPKERTEAAASPPETEEERQAKKARLLQQAEELRKKQEELKQKQQSDEAERRQKMRERRAARKGSQDAILLD